MDHILVEGVCVSPDHYIGGERITSSATFEDISPIDETLTGVLNIVQGLGKDAGASLVAHPGVGRIAFTGSPATARSIGKAAAENITPVGFEVGGKSPFVIFADAA